VRKFILTVRLEPPDLIGAHAHINPTGVIPIGPELDFNAPHDRASVA